VDDKMSRFQSLDFFITFSCRIQIVVWDFIISATMCANITITVDRFIYIMYGMRYLSIVTTRFVKCAIAFTWIGSLIWAVSSYFAFNGKFDDDPECFMGHRAHKMTLIITLSLFLTILLLIYIAYIWIFVSASSQRKRIYEQQWSRCSLANAAPQSKVDIQNSNQGRAKIFILILLTVLTLTWLLFIVLHIYDLRIHENSDAHINDKLREYNCSADDRLQMEFPKLSFQECLYKVATMPNQSDCLSRFKVIEPIENSELCGIVIKLFHGKIMLLWQKCALMFGLLNSLVNPIIYGFWYSQFRIRIVQTWKNFFFKAFKSFSYDQVC